MFESVFLKAIHIFTKSVFPEFLYRDEKVIPVFIRNVPSNFCIRPHFKGGILYKIRFLKKTKKNTSYNRSLGYTEHVNEVL